MVKDYTQMLLQKRLIERQYPKSWQTGFYVQYYDRINRLMEYVTQKIIQSIPTQFWKSQYGTYTLYGDYERFERRSRR